MGQALIDKYSEANMLRIAKRFNNAKRQYLLVNPLQAKHLPARPGEALGMMDALGAKLAAACPGCRLVIGFAETATAIGAAVARHLAGDCIYLTTTREQPAEAGAWLEFLEEHSHAAEQRLCADRLAEWLAATDSVIFVDDEISTGKTLLNMIGQLKREFPGLEGKRLVAASLLNRLSAADEARLAAAGVESQWLLQLPRLEDEAAVAGLEAWEAPAADNEAGALVLSAKPLPVEPLPNPRLGCGIKQYQEACRQMAQAFIQGYGVMLGGGRITVLGTEECMYPALVLGQALEEQGFAVGCHATTRSPIGICREPGYPIRTGVKLASFYEPGRGTYIYNLEPCEALIVVSDCGSEDLTALEQLAGAWAVVGLHKLFFIDGGRQGEPYVWNI